MTKAEEKALEAYPIKDYNKEPNYTHTCDSKMLDEVYREVFRIGYERADKDNELTWKDIRTLSLIIDKMTDEEIMGEIPDTWSDEEYYEEVLKRFKEKRNETI